MKILKVFRMIVLLISFVMFCYQLNTATQNLMNPGTVDSSHERDATDDDMPLITVCPTNQINSTSLEELRYPSYGDMLYGYAICNETTWCTSWGAHANLTFDELKNQVFNLETVNNFQIYGGKYNTSLVFLPGYGFCKESPLLMYSEEIELYHWNPDYVRVFLTDRKYRSYYMPYVGSHIGKEFFMIPYTEHYINVQIQEDNNCNNDESPMSEEEFQKCVDDEIQNEFEHNNISCVPPWLSHNKPCTQTYEPNFYGKFNKYFTKNYYNKLVIFYKNTRIEDKCRQTCKRTTYFVNEEGSTGIPVYEEGSTGILSFNRKVIVTERMPNYNMFKYIVDVGSSLGLWLGLSVLGLHDLVVWAVQFIKRSFIKKIICSH